RGCSDCTEDPAMTIADPPKDDTPKFGRSRSMDKRLEAQGKPAPDAVEIIRKHLDAEKVRIAGRGQNTNTKNAVTDALEKLLVDVALEQARINVKSIVDSEIAAENRTRALQLDTAVPQPPIAGEDELVERLARLLTWDHAAILNSYWQ